MFASGTSPWALLIALNVRSATAVSSSPNVTANALVAVSSLVAWFATSLIVGTAFTVVRLEMRKPMLACFSAEFVG